MVLIMWNSQHTPIDIVYGTNVSTTVPEEEPPSYSQSRPHHKEKILELKQNLDPGNLRVNV